jgi:pimeloyl-ACP methyl ester carboxylesterase
MSYYVGLIQVPRLPEAALSANGHLGLKRALTESSLPGTYTEEDLRHYVSAWAKPGALRAMLGWYRAIPAQAARNQLQPYMRPVTARTLVLFGERDVAVDVRVAEEGMRAVPNGRLIRYPDNTHFLPEERPAEIANRLVEHFTAA